MIKKKFCILLITLISFQTTAQKRIFSKPLKQIEVKNSFFTSFNQNNKTFFSIFNNNNDSVLRIEVDDNDSIKQYTNDVSAISKRLFAIQENVSNTSTSSFNVSPLYFNNHIYEIISYGNEVYIISSNLATSTISIIDSFNQVKAEIPFLSYTRNNTFYLFSYINKSNLIKLRTYNPINGLISILKEIKHSSIYTDKKDNTRSYLLSDVFNKSFSIIEDTLNLNNHPLSDFENAEKIYITDSLITVFYNEQLKLSPFIKINVHDLTFEVDSFVTIPEKKINDDKANYIRINSFYNHLYFTKIFHYKTPERNGILIQVYNNLSKIKIENIVTDGFYFEKNNIKIYEENWKIKEIIRSERKPFPFIDKLGENGIYLYTKINRNNKQDIVIGSLRTKVTFKDLMETFAKLAMEQVINIFIPYIYIQVFHYQENDLLEDKLSCTIENNTLKYYNNSISSYSKILNFINRVKPKKSNLPGLSGSFSQKKPLVGFFNYKNGEYEIYRIQ